MLSKSEFFFTTFVVRPEKRGNREYMTFSKTFAKTQNKDVGVKLLNNNGGSPDLNYESTFASFSSSGNTPSVWDILHKWFGGPIILRRVIFRIRDLMQSLPGAPSFKFLIISSTSCGPTGSRNVVQDNLSPIHSAGDVFALAIPLARVWPTCTKKSLKRSDMIFLSEVIEPSDSLNFSWFFVIFLLFISPFNIDQVFFKLDLLLSNFSAKYFFSAIFRNPFRLFL